jgi:ribonuclease E
LGYLRCRDNGHIKNPELVALEALRKMQAAVIVGHVRKVKARLPSMPAFFLLNNKRAEIATLEAEYKVQILILPDGRLRPDECEFEMEGSQDSAQSPRAQAISAPASTTTTKGEASSSSLADEGNKRSAKSSKSGDEQDDKQRGKRLSNMRSAQGKPSANS